MWACLGPISHGGWRLVSMAMLERYGLFPKIDNLLWKKRLDLWFWATTGHLHMGANLSVKRLFEITFNLKPLFSVSWGPAFPCVWGAPKLLVDSELFWVRVYFLVVKSNVCHPNHLHVHIHIPIFDCFNSWFVYIDFDHFKTYTPTPIRPTCKIIWRTA